MAKEIKQRITLEGEKQYNQAIRDAQRNLKTLRSELKAETAELGKNATEQQKAEAKTKILRKQIEEQEKIVKTLREALQQAKEQYGDNADVVQKWEQQLNNARATLANMRDGLEEVGQGFQNVKSNAETGVVAAKSFADAFGSLGDIGESISGTIESVFSGVLSTIKAAAGEIWTLVTETAAKANNWTDLANYFGSTAEQVQLMDRAISESAGDFGKFTNLVSQLSFGGKNDKIAEWFGVSDVGYKNNIDYTMAVLDAMSAAYEEWGTGGRWDDAMSAIFGGKKSADVSWFVTNLGTIREKMAELNESGAYLLDEKELETMNEAHVKITTLEQRWDELKSKIAAGLFGQMTLDIVTDVQGALDALAEYFNAETPEEREAALSKLKQSITQMFEDVAQAIRDGIKVLEEVSNELKESKDPIVQGIGNILGGLVDALKWFTEDNAHNVVTALEIIAAFWITGKGLTMATKIAGIVANIRAIQLYNSINGGGGTIGGGGTPTVTPTGGSPGVTPGTVATTAGVGSTLLGLGGAVLIGAGFNWAADRRNNHAEEVLGTDANLTASTGGNDALKSAFAEWIGLQNKWSQIEDMTIEATEDEMDAINARIDELWQELNGYDEFDKMFDSYQAWRQENGMSNYQWELPSDFWSGGGDRITSGDLETFRGLPGMIQLAVKAGAASGVSGIRVTLDGRTVGQLVAPYASEFIARELEP